MDRMAGEWIGLALYDVFLREIGAAINAACVAEIVSRGDDALWWECDWRNHCNGEQFKQPQPYDTAQ